MASSRVVASSSLSHTTSDLARFAVAAGKPGGGGGSGLGSMNVEELLRGIYGDIPTPVPAPGGDRPMSPSLAPEIAAAPRTAEEVWKEITGGGPARVAPAAPAAVVTDAGAGAPEMTLEDFLARESVVKEDEVRISGPPAAAEGQVVMGFLNGAEGVGGGGGRGRKRQLMDPMDRAAMQRQKRMIKNRESAERSRERKQAYIAELESQVTQLEEENAQLLRAQEEQNQKWLKEEKPAGGRTGGAGGRAGGGTGAVRGAEPAGDTRGGDPRRGRKRGGLRRHEERRRPPAARGAAAARVGTGRAARSGGGGGESRQDRKNEERAGLPEYKSPL